MPICATCGQPLDAMPLQRACPSCTWRAALRASKAIAADDGAAKAVPALPAPAGTEPAIDEIAADGDPLAMMGRLFAYAQMAGDDLRESSARIYIALLRGNTRPYVTEMNRLVDRYIDHLEETWPA